MYQCIYNECICNNTLCIGFVQGLTNLNLGVWEQRQVAKALITLAVAEPGDNFSAARFQWDKESDNIPGWALPQLWLQDVTMSTKGFLNLYYCSGGGEGLNGCAPNVLVRKALLQMVNRYFAAPLLLDSIFILA